MLFNKINRFLVLFLLILTGFQSQATVCQLNSGVNQAWNSGSNWSCGVMPSGNDTIVIPASCSVILPSSADVLLGDALLEVYGTIIFSNSKDLLLTNNGRLNLYSSGSLSGGNANANLIIGTFVAYSGGTIKTGPQICNSSGCGVLPVRLMYFHVQFSDDALKFEWATATEKDNGYFIIEGSPDGFSYKEIARVKGNINSYNTIQYSFHFPAGDQEFEYQYFRLKQVDLYGTFSYSDVVYYSHLKSSDHAVLAPNPSSGNTYILISSRGPGDGYMKLINNNGKQLLHQELRIKSGVNRFEVHTDDLPSGIYFVQLLLPSIHYDFTFVKQ